MDAVLDAARVMELRREIYSKPEVSPEDLSGLLAQGRAAGAAAPAEYAALISQVAVDLLINQTDPPKYITQPSADWFVGQLAAGGLSCAAEYRMLTDVIREAISVPPSLAAFAVGEIEKATTTGHVAAGGVSDHPAGRVTGADVEALRVAVFAATEGSSLHVTRASAEALFRIAHVCSGGVNDASFDPFFAGAIGDHLMGIAHRWTQGADEVLADEKELTQKPRFGAFVKGLLGQNPADPEARKSVNDQVEDQLEAQEVADDAERALAAPIDGDETAWLLSNLTQGGRLTSAETALLRFLKAESPVLSANLLARAQTAAKAA